MTVRVTFGPPLDDVMGPREAAKLLKIGYRALLDATARGEVPHRRIGKSIRYSRRGLLKWLTPDAPEKATGSRGSRLTRLTASR